MCLYNYPVVCSGIVDIEKDNGFARWIHLWFFFMFPYYNHRFVWQSLFYFQFNVIIITTRSQSIFAGEHYWLNNSTSFPFLCNLSITDLCLHATSDVYFHIISSPLSSAAARVAKELNFIFEIIIFLIHVNFTFHLVISFLIIYSVQEGMDL